LGAAANALQGSLSLLTINFRGVRNETSDRLAMAGNEDFFAALHAIQQVPECVLGFKCPNLQHDRIVWEQTSLS